MIQGQFSCKISPLFCDLPGSGNPELYWRNAVFTLVSKASMLSKLARLLTHEENNQSWSKASVKLDNGERGSGSDALRKAIADVRAERVHDIEVESPGALTEHFKVNYWGDGRHWK
jgi:hypothetical protein